MGDNKCDKGGQSGNQAYITYTGADSFQKGSYSVNKWELCVDQSCLILKHKYSPEKLKRPERVENCLVQTGLGPFSCRCWSKPQLLLQQALPSHGVVLSEGSGAVWLIPLMVPSSWEDRSACGFGHRQIHLAPWARWVQRQQGGW